MLPFKFVNANSPVRTSKTSESRYSHRVIMLGFVKTILPEPHIWHVLHLVFEQSKLKFWQDEFGTFLGRRRRGKRRGGAFRTEGRGHCMHVDIHLSSKSGEVDITATTMTSGKCGGSDFTGLVWPRGSRQGCLVQGITRIILSYQNDPIFGVHDHPISARCKNIMYYKLVQEWQGIYMNLSTLYQTYCPWPLAVFLPNIW